MLTEKASIFLMKSVVVIVLLTASGRAALLTVRVNKKVILKLNSQVVCPKKFFLIVWSVLMVPTVMTLTYMVVMALLVAVVVVAAVAVTVANVAVAVKAVAVEEDVESVVVVRVMAVLTVVVPEERYQRKP